MADDLDELLCLDGAAAAELRSKRIQPFLVNRAARAARLLGDPTRLLIAATLDEAGELCVHDLACVVGREENLVSHHVRALRHAGLAESRRDGKFVMYRLSSKGHGLLGAVLLAGRERYGRL